MRLSRSSLVVAVWATLAGGLTPSHVDASATRSPRILKVKATAYCACTRCTLGLGKTKAGTTPVSGFTLAADPKVFPIGTILRVEGREMMVHDIGSAIRGHHIDIYYDSHLDALRWGVRNIMVEVLHIPRSR